MDFYEALSRWGADYLGLTEPDAWREVRVSQEINEGYACCGGRDPDCYCSFAESPSVQVEILHRGKVTTTYQDFTFLVAELWETSR